MTADPTAMPTDRPVLCEPRDLLPHRYPMLLVDRVTGLAAGEWLTALKAVTANEPWYRAGDAGSAYPPVLVMESWAQAAGILATADTAETDVLGGRVMLFGGATDVVFDRPVHPGDVLEHHVRVVRLLADTAIFEGESRVDGRIVLAVERMVMAFRPAEALRPAAEGENT